MLRQSISEGGTTEILQGLPLNVLESYSTRDCIRTSKYTELPIKHQWRIGHARDILGKQEDCSHG